MRLHQFHLLEVAEVEAVFPDGERSPWEVAAFKGGVTAVGVLGHLRASGQLVMVENFRPSLGRWSLEIAGGLPEPGEALTDAARREFEEETGFIADALSEGPTLYCMPGVGNFPTACFIAAVSRQTQQVLDRTERIRPVLFPATAPSVRERMNSVAEPVSRALLDHFLQTLS